MTIVERILYYAERAGIERKSIYATCGIKQSTFSTWVRANVTSIPSEYVPEIAKVLGVDCNALLTGQEPEYILDENQKRLIDTFATLDWDGQQIVLAKIVEEKRRMAQQKEDE